MTAPLIIGTNRTGGATSGGENDLGSKLSIYLTNPGAFADWGVTSHVTIGGVEVDNYRCLEHCVGDGSGGVGDGVFESFGIWRLTVQVGALGSPTAGIPLNISLTVNGVSPSNPNTAGQYFDDNSGAALTWTPHPVTFIFVSTTGNNSNAGTFAAPLLDLQDPSGFTHGALICATSALTDGIKPAVDIELMDPTAIGYTRPGLGTSWANFFRISGTAITGAADRGPIAIFGCPGPAGANAPHRIHYTAPTTSGDGAGGFMGPDQARSSGSAAETCPYDGEFGWGRFIHISDIDDITCNPLGPRDGCPINLNSSSDDCRYFNIGGQWRSTVSGAEAAKAGFIAGNGYRVRGACLWGHDIFAGDGLNQNHWAYFDGSAVCANDVVISHSCGRNITCGNGLQGYNGQAGDTIQGLIFHDIVIKGVNKHLVNFGQNTESMTVYNVIGIDAGEACIKFDAGALTAAAGFKIFNASFYGWARVLARPAVWNEGGTGTGSCDVRNVIFEQRVGGQAGYSFTSLDNVGTNTLGFDCWFDATGTLTTKPAADATGFYGNPLFVDPAGSDFSLGALSPCLDAGTAPLVTRLHDIFGTAINGVVDIGAIELAAAPSPPPPPPPPPPAPPPPAPPPPGPPPPPPAPPPAPPPPPPPPAPAPSPAPSPMPTLSVPQAIDAALRSLVGGRVYPNEFSQGDPLPIWPSIRYTIVTGDPAPTLCGSGDEDTDDIIVFIDVVAKTYPAMRALKAQVITALQSTDPPCARQSGGLEGPDGETKTHRVVLTYRFQQSSAS